MNVKIGLPNIVSFCYLFEDLDSPSSLTMLYHVMLADRGCLWMGLDWVWQNPKSNQIGYSGLGEVK